MNETENPPGASRYIAQYYRSSLLSAKVEHNITTNLTHETDIIGYDAARYQGFPTKKDLNIPSILLLHGFKFT